MKKYILLLVVSFLTHATVLSQSIMKEQSRHEFTMEAGGGLSALQYDMTSGKMSKMLGGVAGVGYKYYLNRNISVGTGVEFPLYRNKVTVGDISTSYMTTDMEGTAFEYRSKIGSYTETQKVLFINIPLMVQYQTAGNKKFYIAAGGKVGIPSKGEYKISGMNVENRGYYEYEDIEYPFDFMGFGTYSDISKTDTIELKMAFLFSLEAGVKWKINNDNSLYTGIYFDYGLNNIYKKNQTNFVQYNPAYPKNFETNSVLSSQYMQNGETKNFISDKVIPMAIGIKIRWSFEFDILNPR